MAYKYQYNPAATDNVSLHENGRPRVKSGVSSGGYGHTRHRLEDEEKMSGTSRCCFSLLFTACQVLLHGVVVLILYWVIQFRWKDGTGLPFSWSDSSQVELEKQWNLHPFLMLTGFIYCMGQAMLVYRSCRCCRRIHNKLLHTSFHVLAIPCVVVGFLATWNYHSLRLDKEGNPNPIPHFYSIHSWLGALTMGIFLLQFLVGVFSFLVLLCCESYSASYRASLVPIHSAMGTTTFLLAIATALAGLTEKAFFDLSVLYTGWPKFLNGEDNLPSLGDISYNNEIFIESLLLNALGGALALLGVVMPLIIWSPGFRNRSSSRQS